MLCDLFQAPSARRNDFQTTVPFIGILKGKPRPEIAIFGPGREIRCIPVDRLARSLLILKGCVDAGWFSEKGVLKIQDRLCLNEKLRERGQRKVQVYDALQMPIF